MPNSLYCPIRKSWIAALPEELVRQRLVHEMTHQLEYPIGAIAVEVSINQLSHIDCNTPPPKRRADLIVFSKDLHPSHSLYPLLLVECKAVPLTPKVIRQVVGYNQFVKAYFIAVINQTNAYTGWYHAEKNDYFFYEGLPSYPYLLNSAALQHQTKYP